MKSRSKAALINMIVGLLYEAILAVSGILIPRYILLYFGSSTNGMIGSITQFLSIIALLRGGVGGVTRAALYSPLSKGDHESVERILKATQIFMRKIAFIFAGFVLILACTFFFFAKPDSSWLSSFLLVLIIGAGTFSQYYFGITAQLLLQADQKGYVWNLAQIVATLLNIAVCLGLIFSNCDIVIVKLGTAIIYSICPIAIGLYVRQRYRIKLKNVLPDNSAISQRWDAFTYQVATYVHENTDVVLLTFFAPLTEVSVYNVYSLVVNSCVRRVIETVFSGFDAAIGNMCAKNEDDNLKSAMSIFEYLTFAISAVLFSCTLFLLPSFISIYTDGVNDVSYSRPVFSVLLVIAEFFYCLRMPYYAIITAKGIYKNTKIGAILEAVINIVVSLSLIWSLGIIGIAIGTLTAMVFRFVYLFIYTHFKVLKRDIFGLIRYLTIALLVFLFCFLFVNNVSPWKLDNIGLWIAYASVVFAAVSFAALLFSLVFAFKEIRGVSSRIWRLFKR